jgi:alpha-L-arabinofuranosidase
MPRKLRVVLDSSALGPAAIHDCMKKLLFIPLLAAASNLFAAEANITIQVDNPGHAVSPDLFGVFFEDINLSADGGLYPELVRNRSFEDKDTPENWKLLNSPGGQSEIAIDTSRPLNSLNPKSLRLKIDGSASLINEGYWGMNIVSGESYTLKLAALSADNFGQPITAKLLGADGRELATGEITNLTPDWKYHSIDLTSTSSDPKAKLQLSVSGKGTLLIDMVSLMPKNAWKTSRLRSDLAESMNDLKPAFLRFPGGCWVEGNDRAHMYDWKKTIGPVDARTPLYNIWQYNATHGIGYHEYLQMAEDLGAEPLFCINAGMSHKESIPMEEMAPWVQDALDAIEYANGPVTSTWGAKRAAAGHPEPFGMKYLEIGNENGGALYAERWPIFVKAIKAKYPEIILIANHWGTYPKQPMPEIVDEHYYDTPEWFFSQTDRYDSYDRKGPKIFVGEYAVTKNTGNGNLRGALGEAAFMTGLERNSDIVALAAYAPLFCNANHKRWPINLINFDSSRWFGIPSYYVQKMFAENRGTVTLPAQVEAPFVTEPQGSGRIGVGTWKTSAEFKEIKVTAPDGKVLFTEDFSKGSDDWKKLGDGGEWLVDNGVLRQTSHAKCIRALAGDKSWTDYTLTLKARKTGGEEGFLILFHNQEDDERLWWNLGGYGNTQHTIGADNAKNSINGSVETGRWYDIKIELRGSSVKGYIDGKLVQEMKAQPTKCLSTSATLDDKSGDIIVKVVNSSEKPIEAEINLKGARKLRGTGQAIVLTSSSGKDENTLDEPTKVAPKTETLQISGDKFARSFHGNSFTVLRIPVARK